LRQPEVVKLATEEYFEAQDTIGKWIEERCILDQICETKPGALFSDCRQWSSENGEAVLSASQFRGAMERVHGVRYVKIRGHHFVKGVGLRPPAGSDRGQGDAWGEGGGT
jgi:putative DNA primase/helicase